VPACGAADWEAVVPPLPPPWTFWFAFVFWLVLALVFTFVFVFVGVNVLLYVGAPCCGTGAHPAAPKSAATSKVK
jgi:hypothetical protein